MLSYIVGFVALLIFVLNPLSQIFWPSRPVSRTARPQLNESMLALDDANDTIASCPPDSYAVHILSKAPLVLYIEGFLTPLDQEHLLEVSAPLFEPSTITNDGATTHRDAAVRRSEVALVPRTPAVRCVEARTRALQGWRADLWVERLRTQRYAPGGHYGHHFDWGAGAGGWGRVSSVMAWVAAEGVEGGGTEFPLLRRPADRRWCRFLECGVEEEGDADAAGGRGPVGVVFRPIPGNAVFWENFRPGGGTGGAGYDETWHAGLPVTKGIKVGLNIWSWGRID